VCVAIPMKVVEVSGDVAEVESGGNRLKVSVAFLPGVEPGDYVIVHAGCAISRLDAAEAEETLELLREAYLYQEEAADGGRGEPDGESGRGDGR